MLDCASLAARNVLRDLVLVSQQPVAWAGSPEMLETAFSGQALATRFDHRREKRCDLKQLHAIC
jgi:hypothetical protein